MDNIGAWSAQQVSLTPAPSWRNQHDHNPEPDERLCGVMSGIPACCVEFFMTGRQAMNITQRAWYTRELARAQVRAIERAVGEPPQYVPCPPCLRARRFVRIRNCIGHLTPADFSGLGSRRIGARRFRATYWYRCTPGCQRVLWLTKLGDKRIRARCR